MIIIIIVFIASMMWWVNLVALESICENMCTYVQIVHGSYISLLFFLGGSLTDHAGWIKNSLSMDMFLFWIVLEFYLVLIECIIFDSVTFAVK